MTTADIVRDGYDKCAEKYLGNRDRLKSGKFVQQLLKLIPKNSLILDLGCGAGTPIDDVLLKAGHEVVGIDISKKQIQLARKNCPRGDYVVGDISQLKEREYQVQAIVCFYTMFHISREKHGKILGILGSYLSKGGILLISMGDREFEGTHHLHETMMWSSQFGTKKNRVLIEQAGFTILHEELDNTGGERHQVILAEKK